MSLYTLLFFQFVSSTLAVFHRGFIQNLDNFGALQQDPSKHSSCQLGTSSLSPAILKSANEVDRSLPAKQNLRWMRESCLESAQDENLKSCIDVRRVLSPVTNNGFHLRNTGSSDPNIRNSLSNSRQGPLSFAYNGNFAEKGTPIRGKSDRRPLLALCFDFDQTLSQVHIHNLKKGSDRGD